MAGVPPQQQRHPFTNSPGAFRLQPECSSNAEHWQHRLSRSECADDDEASCADSSSSRSSSSLQLEGTPLQVADVGTLLELALAAAAAEARRQAKATHTSLMQHHQLTMVRQAARKTSRHLVERVMQQELEAAWLADTFACW